MTTIELEPDQICPSPTNPRKKFDGIEELAASYETHGQISPVVVRPWRGPAPYQLVVGERRWRAGTVARKAIPDFKLQAFVRELNDTEVLELQLIENGQRQDITPLEEADTFSSLLKDHGYDVTRIADKTGKSHATIRARLLLCKLGERARGLLEDGRMTLEAATRIARIPDAKLQAEALKDLTAGWDFKEGSQITGRQVTQLVERHYMLELAKAPFDTKDAGLVAGVGACGPCPHRTGNQGELFSDIKGKDVCTNPPCFAKKREAGFERKAEAAKAAGLKVLSAKEAKEVFAEYGGVMHGSGYVALDGELGYDVRHKVKGATGGTTWKKVLGKEAPPAVLGKDASGAAVVLVPKAAAMTALKKAGKLVKAEAPAKSSSSAKERAKAKAEAEAGKKALEIALASIVIGITTSDDFDTGKRKELALWRWIVEALIATHPWNAARVMVDRRGLDEDPMDGLEVLATRAKTAAEFRALAVEILVAESHEGTLAEIAEPAFETACRVFGVDWKGLVGEIKKSAEVAAAAPKAPRDDGNRCGLVHGKKGDGCIHELGHEGLHSDGKHTWSDPKPKKARS